MTSDDTPRGGASDRPEPTADGPLDPDDLGAALALEPSVVAPWVAHVATSHAVGSRTSTLVSTGAPLAAVPLSSGDDVADAVASSRGAQRAWARTSVRDRAAVVARFEALVLGRQSQVLDLLQMETGVARRTAFDEVVAAANVCRHHARRARAHLRARRVATGPTAPTRTRVARRPVGVVGVVASTTTPLAQAITGTVPALVAGNGVVLRPEPQTALSVLWTAALWAEAGLPAGLLQVVVGEQAVVDALVGTVDHVVVQGPDAVGRAAAAAAGLRLVGATVVPDAKNQLYVGADADPRRAVGLAVRACFTGVAGPGGRVERVLVHEEVAQEFVARFVEAVRGLRLGTALDYTDDVGSLPSEADLDRVLAHTEDAIALGARVLAGAVHRSDVGPLAYAPTVLDRVPDGARCLGEPTRGPVVVIEQVASDDDAVAALDGSSPLTAPALTTVLVGGPGLARLAGRVGTPHVVLDGEPGTAWGPAGAPVAPRPGVGTGAVHGREAVEAVTTPGVVVRHRAGGRRTLSAEGLQDLDAELRSEVVTVVLRTARALRMG